MYNGVGSRGKVGGVGGTGQSGGRSRVWRAKRLSNPHKSTRGRVLQSPCERLGGLLLELAYQLTLLRHKLPLLTEGGLQQVTSPLK